MTLTVDGLDVGAAPSGPEELLHRGGDGQQRALAARRADELQPDRRPPSVKPAGTDTAGSVVAEIREQLRIHSR